VRVDFNGRFISQVNYLGKHGILGPALENGD